MTIHNQQAKTIWLEDNIPFSQIFDDTYFTKSDGRAETDHVFINGNNLRQRWADTKECTIGELGFGTGLNFIETARQWNAVKQPGASLEFISFELYPLNAQEMHRALARWKELDQLAEVLCSNWHANGDKFQFLFPDNIKLRVNFGDANHTLSQCALSADAWYLDGFSPAKNPQMWNETLMKNVYQASKHGTTFATYTVAGFVRRNLISAGFELSRKKGFGTKREMLSGYRP